MRFRQKLEEDSPKKLSKKETAKQKKQREKEEAERKETERIQTEREELMKLSEKELLVELVLTIRGYNNRLSKLEKKVSSAETSADIAALAGHSRLP